MSTRFQFLWVLWAGLALGACQPEAQPTQDAPKVSQNYTPRAHRIDTTAVVGALEQSLLDSGLIDIQKAIPGIQVNLKYSSTDNFVKEDLYGVLTRCYLRKEAVTKLEKAQAELQRLHPGWSLLVFDGVRPHHIQVQMWEKLDIPFKRNYLAPPWEGSVHNYGCAVDLSVVDSLGVELDMGTPFDFFGKEAQPQLEGMMLAQGKLTETQLENRKLLRGVMKKAGFYDIQTEWWHFNAVANAVAKHKYSQIP